MARTRYQVYMDGEPLDAFGTALYITDVEEASPVYVSLDADKIGTGRRRLRSDAESLTVTISFMLREYDPAERQRKLDYVHKWAMGRYLTASNRPGKRLRVHMSSLPPASALQWTETLTVALIAMDPPYWEEETPTVVHFAQGDTQKSVFMPGTVDETPCSIEAENTGGETVDSLRISTECSMLAFDGLGLAAGERLRVYNDEETGLLRIMIIGNDGTERTAYDKRTAESSDELLVPCGKVTNINNDNGIKMRIEARGRYV